MCISCRDCNHPDRVARALAPLGLPLSIVEPNGGTPFYELV